MAKEMTEEMTEETNSSALDKGIKLSLTLLIFGAIGAESEA